MEVRNHKTLTREDGVQHVLRAVVHGRPA
jgi:hypothetical protein